MRKKYLSALLFGALLFASAGTFTSCKDYDDDINNLQQQIDGLATKEDMQAKLDQMQTAVNDAKATAEEALEKANAAGDADKIAELEGRIADLEETLGDIDAMKEEIQNALDSQIADFREEMEELLKQVEELTGYSLDMVTSIEFQIMDNTIVKDEKTGEILGRVNAKEYDPNLDVNYARVATISYPKDLLPKKDGQYEELVTGDQSYEFGKGYAGAFTIKVGDVNTVTDYMLVNINPANAAVSNDMLSLVNGKQQNLNDYINMTIEPWSGNITTSRATQGTGLRMVGVQLKNTVDFEAFDKLVLGSHDAGHEGTPESGCDGMDHEYIAYALAVTDAEKDRSVTSSYDVTLHVQAEGNAIEIPETSTISSNAASASTDDKLSTWADGEDAVDKGEGCYPIELGEAFEINVKSSSKGGRVMASYVVVDYDNESLSVTDKAALKALSFSGVNTVVKGEELRHSITVSGVAGIPVPLKLVTIDYTGNVEVNIVWVKAGEAVTVNAAYTITPTTYVAAPDKFSIDNQDQLQEFTVPEGTAAYSIELTAGETAHADDQHSPSKFYSPSNEKITDWGEWKVNNTTSFLKLYKADKETPAAKQSEVAYAEFVGALNLQMMREDKAYQGTIKFYDKTGTYLGANSIQVTKKLPTAVPADFSAKTNGIVNGVMTVYPKPTNYASDKEGIYYMNQAFNNWQDVHYELTIEGINTLGSGKNKGEYAAGTDDTKEGDNATANIYSINTDVINDGKTYPSTVKYNYGKILFIPEGHGVIDTAFDYKVTWGTNFDIKFGCWPVDCTYQWSETPVVYYRETNIIKGKVTKDAEGTVTGFENVIKAVSPYKGVVDPFDNKDKDWTDWANAFNVDGNQNVTIILKTTNESGQVVENEYFTAEFVTVNEKGEETTSSAWLKNAMKLTPTGTQVRVGNDVETQVVLRITDKFGHDHDIPALTFTMKINHE